MDAPEEAGRKHRGSGIQSLGEDPHHLFALFTGEGEEFEAVLEAAFLSYLCNDAESFLHLGSAKFDPNLPMFGKFAGQNGAEATFADGNTPPQDSVGSV